MRVFDIEVKRASELLALASKYILKYYADGEIYYDEAICDGYCLAEDCKIQADILAKDYNA